MEVFFQKLVAYQQSRNDPSRHRTYALKYSELMTFDVWKFLTSGKIIKCSIIIFWPKLFDHLDNSLIVLELWSPGKLRGKKWFQDFWRFCENGVSQKFSGENIQNQHHQTNQETNIAKSKLTAFTVIVEQFFESAQ